MIIGYHWMTSAKVFNGSYGFTWFHYAWSNSFTFFHQTVPVWTTSNNQWAFAHPPWQFLGPHHMHPTLSGDQTPSALTKHHSSLRWCPQGVMTVLYDADWCCMCVSFSKGNFGCLQKISRKWEFGWSSHCDWSFTAVHEPMQGGTVYFSSLDNIQCRSMQKESNRTLLKPTLETGLDQNKDQPFQLINETCFHFPRWFINANTRQLQKQQETRPLLSWNCAHKTATAAKILARFAARFSSRSWTISASSAESAGGRTTCSDKMWHPSLSAVCWSGNRLNDLKALESKHR